MIDGGTSLTMIDRLCVTSQSRAEEFFNFIWHASGEERRQRRSSETEPATKMASNSKPRARVVAGRMSLTLPTKGDRCRHEFDFALSNHDLIANIKDEFACC